MSRQLLWLSIPFREPYTTAAGAVRARDLLVLRVDEGDAVGWGEAAPFEPYDGVTVGEVAHVMRERATPMAYPQVHAADEMAFLDLEGRRTGAPAVPVEGDSVPVHFTLAGGGPDDVAAAAVAASARGFDCFKLKAGVPDDEARVAAVRDAVGPDARLRLDANAAWTVAEALRRIDQLAPYGIEFVEQPCATLPELAQVRAEAGVPVAADESVQSASDVEAAAAVQACDVVAVKLAPMGGVSAAREAITAARRVGIEPYVSSTLDGPWGIAASLQLASAERVELHCGLATLDLFEARIAGSVAAPQDGRMRVPAGPGLGVEVDEAALAEVLVQEL